MLTRVVDDDNVEVGVGAALHTPQEVAACMPGRLLSSCMTSAEVHTALKAYMHRSPIFGYQALYSARRRHRQGLTDAAKPIDGHIELLGLSDLLRALGALHA